MDISEAISEIDFKICSDNTVHIIINNDGIKKSKQITINELVNCLLMAKDQGKSNNDTKIIYEDSLTLANTDNVSTVRVLNCEEKNTKIYILFRKNNIVNIEYYDTKFKKIPLPNLLFGVKVVNNSVTASFACCVKKEIKTIDDDVKLYRFPLSNVYKDTRVCWGANKIYSNKVDKSMDIAKIPYMFLTAPYNDDMYASDIPFRKLMEKISKDKCFDESILKPLGYDFSEWINKIKEL